MLRLFLRILSQIKTAESYNRKINFLSSEGYTIKEAWELDLEKDAKKTLTQLLKEKE